MKAVPLAFSMRFTDIGLSMPDLGSSTNASVKSYQLVKVVSGGRAPGKSSSLASPQLLVVERFHCFWAVRLEKVQFLYCVDFLNIIFDHSFNGANAGCCLRAACCCCVPW